MQPVHVQQASMPVLNSAQQATQCSWQWRGCHQHSCRGSSSDLHVVSRCTCLCPLRSHAVMSDCASLTAQTACSRCGHLATTALAPPLPPCIFHRRCQTRPAGGCCCPNCTHCSMPVAYRSCVCVNYVHRSEFYAPLNLDHHDPCCCCCCCLWLMQSLKRTLLFANLNAFADNQMWCAAAGVAVWQAPQRATGTAVLCCGCQAGVACGRPDGPATRAGHDWRHHHATHSHLQSYRANGAHLHCYFRAACKCYNLLRLAGGCLDGRSARAGHVQS